MQVIFQKLHKIIWLVVKGQFITELVVRKIKENQFLWILADETSDCSNQEQLSLVIRYVGSDCVIRQKF